MKIIDCEQRSEAWNIARLGIPTASCFDKIYTPGGKASASWKRYAYHLIAERLLQRAVSTYTSPAMEQGVIVEADAAAWYELTEDVETSKIGFITTDDGKIGASPDRLVGEIGLLEIKCPQPAAQVEYLLTGKLDRTHYPQLQGQLYVSERAWVDVVAWSDELPSTVIRVERDEKYIAGLAEQLIDFNREVDRVMGMIRTVAPKAGEDPVAKQTLRAALRASLEVMP